MEIEFDPAKAVANLNKHGVSFEEAASVLLDPMGLAREDMHSEHEPRWIMLGMSSGARLLVVVYTLRGNAIRIISARPATRTEAKQYA